MRYLTVREVIALHARIVSLSGGALGIRTLEGLESAVAQPQMTFDAAELYPTIHTKAAALGHALIQNHAFLDGNKRIGHAAMEFSLYLMALRLVRQSTNRNRQFFGLPADTCQGRNLAIGYPKKL